MKVFRLTGSLALAAVMIPALVSAGPFDGWSRKQLEIKIMQLHKENKELKAKLADGGGAGASAGSSSEVGSKPSTAGDWLVDDFEGPVAKNNKGWWAGNDSHGMGTKMEKSMVAGKSGQAMNLKGYMPENKEPWPYAVANLILSESDGNTDLTGFRALQFDVKGDGNSHVVKLERAAVKDFAHYEARFPTGSSWKTVTIPLSDFAQPSWGAKVGGGFSDVVHLSFSPGVNQSDFNFSIDNLKFVK